MDVIKQPKFHGLVSMKKKFSVKFLICIIVYGPL